MREYFFFRHRHIRNGDGDGATGGVLIAGGLDVVQHLGGDGKAILLDGAVHDFAQQLLAAGLGDLIVKELIGGRTVLVEALDKAQILGDVAVEDDPAGSRPHHMAQRLVAQFLLHPHPHGWWMPMMCSL